MMKAKDTNNAFSLVIYFFLLQILINSNKASASVSLLSLRDSDKDEQRCGFASCYEKCPPGSCCSWLGYCGTTIKHCGSQYCKTQCPSPPPGPPYAPGQCGVQAEGIKCPTGMCCNELGWCGTLDGDCDPKYCQSQCRLPPEAPPPPPYAQRCGVQGGGKKCPNGMCCGEEGWCGTTEYYCNPQWCQSQCKIPYYLSTKNRTTDEQRCGYQGCYKECPPGSCCSIWGYCGTTKDHCGKPRCQSQCPPPPPPPPPPPYAPGRCGMQAGGRKCPTGLCCSSSGWCGTTQYYCAKQWCQSQCNTLISSTKNSMRGTETFLLDGVV